MTDSVVKIHFDSTICCTCDYKDKAQPDLIDGYYPCKKGYVLGRDVSGKCCRFQAIKFMGLRAIDFDSCDNCRYSRSYRGDEPGMYCGHPFMVQFCSDRIDVGSGCMCYFWEAKE